MNRQEMMERSNKLSETIIGAAIEVHRELGPGLLESAYEACLCHELALRKVPFKRQVPLLVHFKGVQLDCGYRMDILADDLVIVELKSVESFRPFDEAQLLTYLRQRKLWLGLLINFNVTVLRKGIKRMVNG